MKDNELKPCPFCGGEPYDFYIDNFGYWYITCRDCQAEIHARKRKQAKELWNRGVKMKDKEMIEEMAKDLKDLEGIVRNILENRIDIQYIPDLALPIAKEVLKHYQPKLSKDNVVLTEREHEIAMRNQYDVGFNFGYKKGSKEAAEKIFNYIESEDLAFGSERYRLKKWLKEQFGMEI